MYTVHCTLMYKACICMRWNIIWLLLLLFSVVMFRLRACVENLAPTKTTKPKSKNYIDVFLVLFSLLFMLTHIFISNSQIAFINVIKNVNCQNADHQFRTDNYFPHGLQSKTSSPNERTKKKKKQQQHQWF